MRITNNMLSNNFLTDMNNNLQNMKTIQQQMTSGKLYQKPSDNPSAVTRSMQLNTSLNSISQYNSNIQDTTNWLDTTDTALGQAGNVIQRIRELMVSAGNAGYDSSEKSSIKDEINQNISQFAQILNTNFDGKYIFGGTRGNVKPVDAVNNSSIVSAYKGTDTLKDIKSTTVSGKFTGSSDTDIKVKVTVTKVPVIPVTIPATTISTTTLNVSTDDGKTYGKDIGIDTKTGTFDIGNGLNFKLPAGSVSDDTYTINCTSNGNTKLEFCDTTGAELSTPTDMMKSKMKTEISQGVTMDYNVTSTDIIGDGSTGLYDLRKIFTNIVNHLDGKTDDGTADYAAASSKITGSDLADIDSAMNNLLKLRSQVGAKANRMTSALDQNTQQNQSITEILSKTEDIDITQKTMEFATLQTVYLASLQTSAKILQPSLMDYLK